MIYAAPPLAVVDGMRDIAPVAGLGGSAMLWRGACYGCGAIVACAPDCPQPECTGCGRARHGVIEHGGGRRYIPPVVGAVRRAESSAPAAPAARPAAPATVLRPSSPLQLGDPALPGPVRKLAQLAAAHRWPATLTAAVAADARGVVASVALRVHGLGYALYTRRGDSWDFHDAVIADPAVRGANVGQFTAALQRIPYIPPAPRPPAPKGLCPGCGAEVSLTGAGKIYASHRCATKQIEGRS